MPKAVFYANTGSRRSEESFEDAVQALQSQGILLEEAVPFDDVDQLIQKVEESCKSGIELIIAGGGDGTLSAVSPAISENNAVLGVMPLGTANQFSKELGIGQSLEDAAKVIAHGRTCQIDMAQVNTNRFINVATVGVTTEIARSLKYKKQLGTLAYIPAVFHALSKMKPFKVEIHAEGTTILQEVILLVICNGRYHAGPFISSPEASLTNCTLDAYMVEPANMWELANVGAMALTGEHVDLEPVHLVQGSNITVRTEPKKPLTIDGETVWFDEMRFSSLPASLKVCVPEKFRAPVERLGKIEFPTLSSGGSSPDA